MNNEFEQVVVEFNTKAQKLFFLTYERFHASTRRLDRKKDENVFQQQLGKYLYDLKLQLENIASELLHKYKSLVNINRYNSVLTDQIKDYLNEFRQKSRSH